MSLEQQAQILQAAASGAYGVRDLANKLRWKTSTIVSMARSMEEEMLIESQVIKRSSRGRPKKNLRCTALGFDFLGTYRKLKLTPLRARKADLERAKKDALYTQKLVEKGHSAFELFMELNAIVCNIRNSSETYQAV